MAVVDAVVNNTRIGTRSFHFLGEISPAAECVISLGGNKRLTFSTQNVTHIASFPVNGDAFVYLILRNLLDVIYAFISFVSPQCVATLHPNGQIRRTESNSLFMGHNQTTNNRMKFMLIENLFRTNDDQFIYVSCRCATDQLNESERLDAVEICINGENQVDKINCSSSVKWLLWYLYGAALIAGKWQLDIY